MNDDRRVLDLIEDARQTGRSRLAVLLDPDGVGTPQMAAVVERAAACGVELFFVGGSLMTGGNTDRTIELVRRYSDSPVVLFPGSVTQISDRADALLFLALLSGRNPELLIGQHVVAAPLIRQTKLEVIPTAYLLVDGGRPTTASYVSQSAPIPHDKPEIAACTALAGQYLGHRLTYLDTGSGALQTVSADMIRAVRRQTDRPIVVGGGIDTPAKAEQLARAGADVVVVGTAFERKPALIEDMLLAVARRKTVADLPSSNASS